MNKGHPRRNSGIDSTLKDILFARSAAPMAAFFLITLLYIVAYISVMRAAYSEKVIFFMGTPVPYTAFTGVFSSLANICILSMVALFKKLGFYTSMAILVFQFPLLMNNFIIKQSTASIPGLFINLLTVLAITIIHINDRRIDKYQQHIRSHAVTDYLTGLPNHFACLELMNRLIRRGEKFAVVSVDIKNFKSVNDTMGHENGDRVLIEIASRWKALADSQNTGTRDFIARLSGDDFSIIIRNYESGEKITETINAYEAELEKKITVEDCDFFLSAFFGFAEYPYDSNDSMVLFSHADAALHEVQRLNTGSRIFRFNPKLLKNEQDLDIERKIRTALENDRILFHLQPQYTTEHKLRGFEALARIKNNDGTFISPADFIPVAENAGLIDRIDIQVLKKAVTFLSDILKQQDTDIVICVNISVRHLMKNNFIEEIKEIIYSSIVNPNRFEFEITESIMIDSAETALQRIDELKKMGIKIAIDDFGTGYSSLSYLYKLPADILKIDKSFIDVMNADESSKKYVSTIISIGHILNLEVVSEGVETEEQLKTLKETGCDYIQGYVWGRPVPPEEAAKLISD